MKVKENHRAILSTSDRILAEIDEIELSVAELTRHYQETWTPKVEPNGQGPED